MRRAACLALAAALIAAGPLRADDRSDILALYANLSRAFAKKDTTAFMALLTPDFVNVDHGKKTLTAEFEQQLDTAFGQPLGKLTLKPTKITISGQKAVVLSDTKLMSSRPDKNGKKHSVVEVQTSRDNLVKGADGWKVASSTNIKTVVAVDGKHVNLPAAQPKPSSAGTR